MKDYNMKGVGGKQKKQLTQRVELIVFLSVPRGRIELPLPKEHDFESCASTNSATSAYILL